MDDYQLNIKERYEKIVELQYTINSELDSIKSFLSQLISNWDHSKQTLIHTPDYLPVLQTQEELVDQVTTDQISLFDVIKESISNETLNEMIIDINQNSKDKIDNAVKEALTTGKSITEIKVAE